MGEAQHSTADAWKGSAHLLDVGDGVPWKAVLATLCRQEAPALWRRVCADLRACTQLMPQASLGKLRWRLRPRQAAQYAPQLVALPCILASWRSKGHERNNLQPENR